MALVIKVFQGVGYIYVILTFSSFLFLCEGLFYNMSFERHSISISMLFFFCFFFFNFSNYALVKALDTVLVLKDKRGISTLTFYNFSLKVQCIHVCGNT